MGKYKPLTDKERCQIESFLHAGYKQSEIAKTLGRSKSTIHTELNRLQCNQVGYNADDAQHDSDQKKLTQRRCSRKLTEHKWLEIERLLKNFPKNILLFGTYFRENIVGGVLFLQTTKETG